MEKVRKEIEVGVKYVGYGVLNEFGEWTFIPSQVGSRAGRKKFVCEDDNYTVYSTNKKVIVHITLERGERIPLIQKFSELMYKIIFKLKEYDFRCISTDKDKKR